MPIVGEKKPLTSWESWQKHINKKFGVEEQEPVVEKPAENPESKAEEEIVSLEFLERPVE